MNPATQKKYKVAILSRSFGQASDEPFRYLESHGMEYITAHNNEPENTDAVAAYIGDADAVIVGSDVINDEVLVRCPNLKVISKHGVGLDSIDLEAAKRRGIRVTITAGANNETVADLTLLLMLSLMRDLRGNMITCASPDWGSKPLSRDLYRATVGLIGYGKIGAAVARRLSGFECDILVYDPFVSTDNVSTSQTRMVSLDDLLQKSDLVSLHLPLSPRTANLIDSAAIAKMKRGAMIVNTSRGGLIDNSALYEALVNGKLGGAGLDVYTTEPPVNDPVLTLPNVMATPHIATHTAQCNSRMGVMAARNIVEALCPDMAEQQA